MKYFVSLFLFIVCLHGADGLILEELISDRQNFENLDEKVLVPVPITMQTKKSPYLAVGLSSLFPGLGHVYLGDMKTASGLMGSAAVGMGAIPFAMRSEETLVSLAMAVQTSWTYGLYSAYRDVRIFNGESNYRYKMPRDTFGELAFAPFSWSVIKKPEVWGGFLGTLAVAAGVGYFSHTKDWRIHSLSSRHRIMPLHALPIAISEESLFRGFLQSQISEAINPTAGIILSSVAFGAAHIPNGFSMHPEERKSYYAFGIPMITLSGAYMGWLSYKNSSLKESVALHMWYDFLLLSIGALATLESTGFNQFGAQFTF